MLMSHEPELVDIPKCPKDKKKKKMHTDAENINAFKKWVEINGQVVPKHNDIIDLNGDIFKIGLIVSRIKQSNYLSIKDDINDILGCDIPNMHIYNKYDYIKIFNEWVNQFGDEFPKFRDVMTFEGNFINVGMLFNGLKHGCRADIKEDIEKLFGKKILKIDRHSPLKATDEEWIIMCNKWVLINGFKLPRQRDTIKFKELDYHIGEFISSLKRGYRAELRKYLEKEVFKQEIKLYTFQKRYKQRVIFKNLENAQEDKHD